MTIYKITANNITYEFSTLIEAELFASQNQLDLNLIITEERLATSNLHAIIDSILSEKQSQGLNLLREIFVQNTIDGISTAESKDLFRNHMDIIICILVGAFPTAYSMINEIQPSGFMTQERLNSWKSIMEQYL